MLRKKFFTAGLLPDGVFAICGGFNSTSTYRYTFINDNVVPATAMSAVSTYLNYCCGNAEKSIWGYPKARVEELKTNKYMYASNTTAAGGNLTIANTNAGGGTASTPFFGLITTSNSTNLGKINKYTFATDSSVTAPSGFITTVDVPNATGIGNKSSAIFTNVNGNAGQQTNKYTYSGDVITPATTLVYGGVSSYSTMTNKDFGLFLSTSSFSERRLNKYLFASDTVVPGTSLIPPTLYAGGCGNSVTGIIFSEAANNAANKYLYASDTVNTAGTLPVVSRASMANGCTGVNV